MSKPIIWSPSAEKDFSAILDYLMENWDPKVVRHFVAVTSSALSQISDNPGQYPLIHKDKNIRKCVLTRHNTLYYRAGLDSIDVLRIYDNRQDPDKLKF